MKQSRPRRIPALALAFTLLLALALPAAAAATSVTDVLSQMPPNAFIADVNGTSETFTLERYNNFGGGPSITFSRKDARGEYLDSITLIVATTPYVGNVIDTHAADVADYGAGSIIYTNYTKGTPKNYQASFSCQLSGGTDVDTFFSNPTASVVVQPSANAYYRLTFDLMSGDGFTLGGTFRGVLINADNGSQVTIENGYFNYTAR